MSSVCIDVQFFLGRLCDSPSALASAAAFGLTPSRLGGLLVMRTDLG